MDEEKAINITDQLQNYLAGKMKVYVPLASELQKPGYRRDKKWMIIANTHIESDL
jgi:hypothetical protein